jgi:diketogulonate reductase-like aldo/keto reductase
MPRLGLDAHELIDPERRASAVGTAIEAGYRHVATAGHHENEAAVGETTAASDGSSTSRARHGADRAVRHFVMLLRTHTKALS